MSMRRPPAKLDPEDLVDLNRRVLEETAFEGDRPHGVQNAAGLRRTTQIVQRYFLDDPIKRATLLCCALVANHPFNDGNHRTSLEAATLQLLMDGWLYSGTEADEKDIYNWRFDYEEEHGLESEWAAILGGWDTSSADRYLLELVDAPYGKHIEDYLRKHSVQGDVDAFLLFLPPARYASDMRAYPSSAWKKELNRKRRANASKWRKTVWPLIEDALKRHDAESSRPRPPQPHWRPEKL